MARAKWKNPNADLIKAVQDHTDQIIEFYEKVEYDQPVIVLDFQRQQIQAYHYEEYKVRLSKESQVVLDEEYKKDDGRGQDSRPRVGRSDSEAPDNYFRL